MIYELHYDNTNTYMISGNDGMLLFDTGWAGTFMKMCRALGEQNLKLSDIKYLLVSHFHPDHMGLAGELASQGIKVVVMESQTEYIHASDYVFERDKRFAYTAIPDHAIYGLPFEESRAFLRKFGIEGEVIPTPGHSDDSISLVLDSGDVFVGDLYPLYELGAHDEVDVQESWKKILAANPKRIYYGHAKTALLDDSGEELYKAGENAKILEESSALQTENTDKNKQKNVEMHDTVKKIMHLIDKGVSIGKIASKLRVEKEFVSDVCRMYLTHKNVSVQGILDRIEIKGK